MLFLSVLVIGWSFTWLLRLSTMGGKPWVFFWCFFFYNQSVTNKHSRLTVSENGEPGRKITSYKPVKEQLLGACFDRGFFDQIGGLSNGGSFYEHSLYWCTRFPDHWSSRLYPETCPSDLILRLLGLLPRSGIAIALATVVVWFDVTSQERWSNAMSICSYPETFTFSALISYPSLLLNSKRQKTAVWWAVD